MQYSCTLLTVLQQNDMHNMMLWAAIAAVLTQPNLCRSVSSRGCIRCSLFAHTNGGSGPSPSNAGTAVQLLASYSSQCQQPQQHTTCALKAAVTRS